MLQRGYSLGKKSMAGQAAAWDVQSVKDVLRVRIQSAVPQGQTFFFFLILRRVLKLCNKMDLGKG